MPHIWLCLGLAQRSICLASQKVAFKHIPLIRSCMHSLPFVLISSPIFSYSNNLKSAYSTCDAFARERIFPEGRKCMRKCKRKAAVWRCSWTRQPHRKAARPTHIRTHALLSSLGESFVCAGLLLVRVFRSTRVLILYACRIIIEYTWGMIIEFILTCIEFTLDLCGEIRFVPDCVLMRPETGNRVTRRVSV